MEGEDKGERAAGVKQGGEEHASGVWAPLSSAFILLSFHLSVADRVGGEDETWVHHAFVALGLFFSLT